MSSKMFFGDSRKFSITSSEDVEKALGKRAIQGSRAKVNTSPSPILNRDSSSKALG
jgi:hypothetical protein